ncbi:hypothetical protein BPC006_I1764 [Burkholderia pseudomallei BPC006]|nr:hypothetical protein BPC006_I1764 [Burkholderia pseudomallei BPC006]
MSLADATAGRGRHAMEIGPFQLPALTTHATCRTPSLSAANTSV